LAHKFAATTGSPGTLWRQRQFLAIDRGRIMRNAVIVEVMLILGALGFLVLGIVSL
jgi:hypothetical protein